ncbi:MAG: TetR/AcrR family transcriptional regulator [bacterium]|nr:TetR/AcrR family transcriptional regulator [bacterium]
MPEKNLKKIENSLINAAYNEFLEKGYQRTTLKDISKRFGVSNKNTGKMFHSKKDIFRSVFEKERIIGYKKLEKLFLKVDTGKTEDIKDVLNKMFTFVSKSRFLEMIYRFGDFPLGYCLAETGNKDGEPIAGQTTLLERFIENCQVDNKIRKEDPVLIANAFRNLIFVFLQERRYMKNSKKTDKLMVEIFIDGLLIK